MVGNNRRDRPAVNGQTVHMTAKFSRGLFGFKKRVRGNSARKHHHLRIQKLQLTSKKGRAGRNFIVMRIAIVGRSAFEHIDNGHINGAFQTDRMKDVFKKLPALSLPMGKNLIPKKTNIAITQPLSLPLLAFIKKALSIYYETTFQLYIISSITPPHILHFFFSLAVVICSVYHKIFQVLYYIFNLFYLFLCYQ